MMLKATTTAIAGLLLLAGCGEAPLPSREATSVASPQTTGSEPPRPFYVGRWAANRDSCGDAAWVIDEKGLQAPGEVTCQFESSPQGSGPIEIDATCHAEGPPREWRLRFAYAQSAQALLIENGPFADAGLIRCDPAV